MVERTTLKEIVTADEWGDYKLIFGYDGSNWRPILIDNAGQIKVIEASASGIATNIGLIKTAIEKIDDLQAALKSVDTDELICRVTNSSGVEINPAEKDEYDTALTNLQSELEAKLETADLDIDVSKYLSVNVQNHPADYPDSAVATAIGNLQTELEAKLETADLDIDVSKYLSVNVKNSNNNWIYDYATEKYSLLTSRGGGKNTFYKEYTADQTDLVIIPCAADRRIQIVGVYMATDAAAGEIRLKYQYAEELFFPFYASKYQHASQEDMAVPGYNGCGILLTTTTGATNAFVLVNYRVLDATDGYYPPLSVTQFQVNAGTGTFNSPANVNDGSLGTEGYADSVNEYVEIELPRISKVNQFRHYGSANNEGTGDMKLQYWHLTNEVWTDWETGIATRGASWSEWKTLAEVTTSKIKLVSLVTDGWGRSKVVELECRYA